MSTLPTRWDLQAGAVEAYHRKNAATSRLHWHSHYLLIMITGGEGVQTLNGKEYPLEAGQVYLLSPVDFHCNTTSGEGFDYYGVKFHYDFAAGRLSSLFGKGSFPLFARLDGEERKTATQLFELLVEESTHPREGSEVFSSALVEALLVLSARRRLEAALPKPAVGQGREENRRLLEAAGYIETHFRERLTVESIGRYVGYTTHYFSCLFKEKMGISCSAYIQNCRLSFAKKLLAVGELSITEVSYEAGFGSPAYFSSLFKKAFGLTPQEYRNGRENIQKDKENGKN